MSISEDFYLPESESIYRKNVSRHVVSSRQLEPGHIISAGDFLLKRSSNSSAISDPSQVLGKQLSSKTLKNHPFEPGDFIQ